MDVLGMTIQLLRLPHLDGNAIAIAILKAIIRVVY